MASANSKGQKRELGLLKALFFYKMCQDMGLHMIHVQQRDIEPQGHGFGKGGAYQQGTHESGASGKGDS